MNTPLLETLLQKTPHEALTHEEHGHMRTRLADYAAFRPVGRPAEARVTESTAWWLPRPVMAFATAFLVLFVGAGGSAYAAEGALPGDLLYPIKVGVTEPAVSVFTAQGKAQTSWQMQLAERRITEAAVLAKEGRLSSDTEAMLATRFTRAAQAAAADVENEDPVVESIASTGFTTRLAAYDQVLAQTEQPSHTETAEGLRTAISNAIASWKKERKDVSAVAAATSTKDGSKASKSRTRTDGATLARAARAAVQHAADTVGLAKGQLDATASTSANHALSLASTLVAQGEAQLAARDDEGAAQSFRASLDAATRIDVFTRAAATLQINAFMNASSTESDNDQPATTTDVSAGGGGASVIEGVIRIERDQVDSKKSGGD